jgi:hypothetical protein
LWAIHWMQNEMWARLKTHKKLMCPTIFKIFNYKNFPNFM